MAAASPRLHVLRDDPPSWVGTNARGTGPKRRVRNRQPDQLDDLLKLSGVGRKTANILRGNAFGQPAIGVDTHVGRLSQRLGLTDKEDPDDMEADLAALVPREEQVKFCHLLQFHGRRTCIARKPDCPHCVIASLCPFPGKTGG